MLFLLVDNKSLFWLIARQNKAKWKRKTENTERKGGRVKEGDIHQVPKKQDARGMIESRPCGNIEIKRNELI